VDNRSLWADRPRSHRAKSSAGIRGLLPDQSGNSGFFTDDFVRPVVRAQTGLCGFRSNHCLRMPDCVRAIQ